MRRLPRGFEVTGGVIRLGAADMRAKSERELNAIRGRRIAMLFQQPQVMLDPTATVEAQASEPLRLYPGMSRRSAARRVVELLREVGIPEPEYRARSYAFQLSGGMAQCVMIAAALGGNPDVLIADEPTTALGRGMKRIACGRMPVRGCRLARRGRRFRMNPVYGRVESRFSTYHWTDERATRRRRPPHSSLGTSAEGRRAGGFVPGNLRQDHNRSEQ